ncbi:phosphatidylserine decarboxylase 1 [Microbotryomycetes sp. JL221]|nr:phosphatidylserine decarboxylase 1 [Microbotryomycetes sp. JL221]
MPRFRLNRLNVRELHTTGATAASPTSATGVNASNVAASSSSSSSSSRWRRLSRSTPAQVVFWSTIQPARFMLRGPRLLLRAPGAIVRAAPRALNAYRPTRSKRLFGTSTTSSASSNATLVHGSTHANGAKAHSAGVYTSGSNNNNHGHTKSAAWNAGAPLTASSRYRQTHHAHHQHRRHLHSTSNLYRQQPPPSSQIHNPAARPAAPEPGSSKETIEQQQQRLAAEQQQQEQESHTRGSFTQRLRQRWNSTETKWYPIPVSLGAAVLVGVSYYKQRRLDKQKQADGNNNNQIRVSGPWQVHVIGALPLRSISRLYGYLNSYTLPVWFRTPGYRFYSWVFGVNLDECEPRDLREYRSMSEFFMRRLKDGARPIDDSALVSPADGRVVNYGTVEGGRVAQIKGGTYSLDALLAGTGQVDNSTLTKPHNFKPHPQQADPIQVDEKDFADVNGIHYTLDQLIGKTGGTDASTSSTHDATLSKEEELEEQKRGGLKRSLTADASVAKEVSALTRTNDAGDDNKNPWSGVKEGNKLFFTVIYLAPGDYHRYHSPTNWVVERRRHFAGELFSVSPWMVSKLADLFVVNERVALLGRWRHGFFSMVPVGATNVGSIRVNFDSSLRTNSPLRPITPGTFSEATYAKASTLLGGQPLRSGDEIGGFWLGSTIVLVFEAPEKFEFKIQTGQKVRVGQALGDVRA